MNIKEILVETMKGYAKQGANGYGVFTRNEAEDFFVVACIGYIPGKRIVDAGLVVRLVNEHIIIEHDINDKILLDALLQAGVPREQIVLAYIGESAE